jgi:hypothetical protein
MSVFELIDKCLFCNKSKKWNSIITMQTRDKFFNVTVCPSCRKIKTISDMYLKISNYFLLRRKVD